MSAKFKPKKREAEPIVDDWEASDAGSDDLVEVTIAEGSSASQKVNTLATKSVSQDAWGDDEREIAIAAQSKPDGMALWEEANRAAPQAQPVVTNRSLPSTVFSPRLHTSSSGDRQQSAAPPPPQILRREKVGYGVDQGLDKGNEKKKTLKEREEEYRKARERIFGSTSAAASSESQATNSRPGSASGHSSGSSKHQQQPKGHFRTKP